MTKHNPEILFLLNFTTSQRTALLSSASTKALLYTPANEHFGIVPVEAMACGVPVLACNSGGPTESVLDQPRDERTGWLCTPDKDLWSDALVEIVSMDDEEREALSIRAQARARTLFGMDAMAAGLEDSLVAAAEMGSVSSDIAAWAVLFGFLFAYAVGPFVLASG